MVAVTPFDTLKFATALKDAGVPAQQAEAEARAIATAVGESDFATGADLRDLELRLTVKVGAMLTVAVSVLTVVIKLH